MTTAGTIFEALQASGAQCGALQYVTATALSYLPFRGDQIKINGIWRTIPASGVVGLSNSGVFVNGVAGQNLVANTHYYIYAFMNGAVVTADWSTTTHAMSTTAGNYGTEIKSGDDTRTLLGMARYFSDSKFYDDLKNRLVRSWVNRDAQRRDILGSWTAQVANTSINNIELNTAIRCNFLQWLNESVSVHFMGQAWNDATYASSTRMGWDGVTRDNVAQGGAHAIFTADATQQWNTHSVSESRTLPTETQAGAAHYATMMGRVGGTSTTKYGQNSGVHGTMVGVIHE
jgi:hypothetical protein